jgi:hypothetical protein
VVTKNLLIGKSKTEGPQERSFIRPDTFEGICECGVAAEMLSTVVEVT